VRQRTHLHHRADHRPTANAGTINASGNLVGLTSSRDLTPSNPGNPDGNFEIFVVTGAVAIPTLGTWAQIAMLALLLGGGLCALRRRSRRGAAADVAA
jgi:hypothetical protein